MAILAIEDLTTDQQATFRAEIGAVNSPITTLNENKVNWPLTGNYYAIGDSQTYGTNASGGSYTTSGRINSEYQWPEIFAGMEGRALTTTNLGRPGQKILDLPAEAGKSIWNSWGEVPESWTGALTMMLGYNNCDSETIYQSFYNIIERAYTAFIARALVDDYAGIGLTGFGATGVTQDSFTTTGTALTVSVPTGEASQRMGFYYGSPNGSRLLISLATGQYVQFTASNKKALALFLYSSNGGGTYSVTVNGSEVTTGATAYTGEGGNDTATGQYPLVAWLENLPATAVIRLTATGTVLWQAYGTIPITGALTASKQIALAGPTGNQNASRTDRMLTEMNFRARSAVDKFKGYPVGFADTWTNWNINEDDEPSDASHFTIAGNLKVAKAFAAAGANRPVLLQSPVLESTLWTYLESMKPVNINPATWGIKANANGGALLSPDSIIQARCSNTAGSTIVANSMSEGGMSELVRASDSVIRDGRFINFDLPMRIGFTIQAANQTTNGVGYVKFGVLYTSSTVGPLTAKGFGIRLSNNQLHGQVYNTALITSNSLGTIISGNAYRVGIELLGGGVAKFYFNGMLVWETNDGPQGNGSGISSGIEVSATNGADAAYYIFGVSQMSVIHMPILSRV